ncbi:hypothetical protein WZ342_2550 [Enterococcus faecalis]|nr:hypothetical protein WZ342_2550 [Enterococcus faecalis]
MFLLLCYRTISFLCSMYPTMCMLLFVCCYIVNENLILFTSRFKC